MKTNIIRLSGETRTYLLKWSAKGLREQGKVAGFGFLQLEMGGAEMRVSAGGQGLAQWV